MDPNKVSSAQEEYLAVQKSFMEQAAHLQHRTASAQSHLLQKSFAAQEPFKKLDSADGYLQKTLHDEQLQREALSRHVQELHQSHSSALVQLSAAQTREGNLGVRVIKLQTCCRDLKKGLEDAQTAHEELQEHVLFLMRSIRKQELVACLETKSQGFGIAAPPMSLEAPAVMGGMQTLPSAVGGSLGHLAGAVGPSNPFAAFGAPPKEQRKKRVLSKPSTSSWSSSSSPEYTPDGETQSKLSGGHETMYLEKMDTQGSGQMHSSKALEGAVTWSYP